MLRALVPAPFRGLVTTPAKSPGAAELVHRRYVYQPDQPSLFLFHAHCRFSVTETVVKGQFRE